MVHALFCTFVRKFNSMKKVQFKDDFPPATKEEWLEKITADLKGKPFSKLIRESLSGFVSNPVYMSSDISDDQKTFHSDLISLKPHNRWLSRQTFHAGQMALIKEAVEGKIDEINIESPELPDPIDFSVPFYCLVKNESEYDQALSRGIKPWVDPIGEWLKGKTPDLEMSLALKDVEGFRIQGNLLHESGADPVYELAASMSWTYAYVFAMHEKGMTNEANFEICLSSGLDFFPELAKFRAARLLFSRLFDITKSAVDFKISAKTSSYYLGHLDTYTNLLRNTTMALSAAAGGADILEIIPHHDPADGISFRMARNIHHLLRYEAYIDKVADPAGGSYLVETMTKRLIEAAWKKFQDLEKAGGWLKLVQEDGVNTELKKAHEERLARLSQKDWKMIGINIFPNKDGVDESPSAWSPDFPGDHVVLPRRLSTEIAPEL